jgi:hypothetical protein
VNKVFFHALVGCHIVFSALVGESEKLPEALHLDRRLFHLQLMKFVTGVSVVPWNHRSQETYAKAAREKMVRRIVFVKDELPMQGEGGSRELRSRRLLGLGLEEMEIVARDQPLIMRKDTSGGTDGWKLVGECYMYVMMDSGVSDFHRVEVGEMLSIRLCNRQKQREMITCAKTSP